MTGEKSYKRVIRGKEVKFEVPEKELYCEQCETTNFIYADTKPPYKCDQCNLTLELDNE